MAITLVPMTCPQCGATVDVPVTQDVCFCTYCGTKILINNDSVQTININKTSRKVDEAKLAEMSQESRRLKVAAIAVAGMLAVGLLCLLIGFIAGGNELIYIAGFALIMIAFISGINILDKLIGNKEQGSA